MVFPAAQRIKNAPEGDQIALALSYQLITKNTNCLLVHIRSEDEKATDLPELMNVAQMQAAGWAGAGTVNTNPTQVLWRMATVSRSMALPAVAAKPATNIDYALYDLPRVFRSSREADDSAPTLGDLDAFASSKKSLLERGADYYEIPSFLRKQDEKEVTPKPKILDPKDVIEMANEILIDKKLIGELVGILDESVFEDELLEIFKTDLSFLNKQELWSAVLAWILLQLEEYGDWNEQTIAAIEELTNDLEPAKLNKAFQVFNVKMADLGMHGWLTLDFD